MATLSMDKSITISLNNGADKIPELIYNSYAFDRKKTRAIGCHTSMTLDELTEKLKSSGFPAEMIDNPRFLGKWKDYSNLLIEYTGYMVLFTVSKEYIYFSVSGESSDIIFDRIKALIPSIDVEDDTIPVKFWSSTKNGPLERIRQIEVPTMESIANNYNAVTFQSVSEIEKMVKPSDKGKLILFHGPPGTGKTFCIRSIARTWSKWCSIEYITDPEQFFGDSSYLMSMLVEDESNSTWRLFIMEDVDEFLTVDAKHNQGQSMARLLNLSNGFIGQGINLIILMTTNESISKLNAAIKRPGRCLADVQFNELSHDEVVQWCKHNGVESVPSGSRSLAQLYNETGFKKIESVTVRRAIGFNRDVKESMYRPPYIRPAQG